VVLRALALAALASVIVTACSKPPGEMLQLDGNLLTVDNHTAHDWNKVEIWLNRSYRVTTPSLAAGSRVQVPLDTFVEGFGRRFDWHRAQIRELRLTATLPDGTPFETEKRFEAGGLRGLADALKKDGRSPATPEKGGTR
jgi:hypothetical protein